MEGVAPAVSLLLPRASARSPVILAADSTRRSSAARGITRIPKLGSAVSTKRTVAAVRLLRIEKGKAFVDLLNETANDSGENEMGYVERTLGFSTRYLEDRDIRLVTVVVAGTVRWKRYLDYLIMSLCSEEKLFREMEPLLLQILRIGFFEILKLGVPAYAAVDENKSQCSTAQCLVVSVVDPKPGETIVDCCAAPGGKTLFMASRLLGQGKIWAVDVNKGRLRILKDAAKAHGLDDMITDIHADLRQFAKDTAAKYDKVLLDAPCSGLGVLSKRADLRWNRQFEDLEELTSLQDELLDSASMLVKPGGILIYSTCSIDPEENEKRITAFIQRHPEFVPQSVCGYVPTEFITDEGFYSSSPTKHSMDGAFAARLVRSVL
ncbi:hypothetical protein PR202_gb22316 [Eleusine coracana subsp. coracana]|uniref:SAM-dependent MTase RsmB/NOP-type domain-containing protein n=1 Tax=Eleusine coracana subsp. coracana TaxID=191504 RepID=A0AAV5FFG2_ELECO|nr:hypothetical protein PR202_gb22316 [Eleusine coracana subsp. coracana]